MGFQLPELPVNISGATYGAAAFIAIIIVIAKLSQGPNLDAIPAVGSSTRLGAWWAGFKYLTNAHDIIQQGYKKYKSAPFKVAEPTRWLVILSSREHLKELVKASDNELSFREAINEKIQIEHTLGPDICHNLPHLAVLSLHLTRNVKVLYPEVRNEIVTSFAEVLDLVENEWKSVPALGVIKNIVCRATNRAFVGLPLCRDSDWIDLNVQFTRHLAKGGVIIGMFPKFMRSLATHVFTNIPRSLARGVKFLGPMIEERRKYLKEYGTEWDDKPNDLLSWMMDGAEGPELTAEIVTTRVMVVNFAAIETSSNLFTQALFRLAANPQYIKPLREEVEGIVEKYGWSKVAIGKMWKVDSFLKECQRIEGLNIVTVFRKALKDYTFSDGSFIPKGTSIAAPTISLHHDKNFYENPEVFEPFRFAHLRRDGGPKHQFTSTSTEYLSFGHGKHACPGRFFAAAELKFMLAHVVVTYDVKLEDNAMHPPSEHIATFIVTNARAKVMFRNRVD